MGKEIKIQYKPWQHPIADADDKGLRKYRYTLAVNVVNKEKIGNQLVVIGINPSYADDNYADPTICCVEEIAEANDYDGFIMANVYPQRATDIDDQDENTKLPKNGYEEKNQIEKNLQKIYDKVKNLHCRDILLAYGGHIEDRKYLKDCLLKIYQKLSDLHPNYKMIKVSKSGHPWHPLYALRYAKNPKTKTIIPADFNLIKIKP